MILITTLAEYQTRFWMPVAQALIRVGREVEVLAFDERSAEMLDKASVPYVNVFRHGLSVGDNHDDLATFEDRLALYGIGNPNLFLSHERITFAIRDTPELARRFVIYSNALENVLDRHAAEGRRCIMLQELGGFISVVVSFFAARRRGLDNHFLEPTFFKGRLAFVTNTFAALQMMREPTPTVSEPVDAYLEQACRRQSIVVPKKDKHHYSPALSKVVNAKNARRLFEKVYDQYVLRKHQEFGHNIRHMRAHVNMAYNAWAMRKSYGEMPADRPFVYYPLHVPADMALTLRSPEYLDQMTLIEYVLRVIPSSHVLVVKEHPAQIGAIPARRFKKALARYDNLIVLSPDTNNYDVLGAADVVVTVNSKSGAEAMLLGKPVVVLGDGFYTECPRAFRAERLGDLASVLRRALHQGGPDTNEIRHYFQTAWDMSHPGELYVTDEQGIEIFVSSLTKQLDNLTA